MVTFTINIPQMLAFIPYMDPMGIALTCPHRGVCFCLGTAPHGAGHLFGELAIYPVGGRHPAGASGRGARP